MQNVSGRMCFRYYSVTLLSVNYQFIDYCVVFFEQIFKTLLTLLGRARKYCGMWITEGLNI